MRSHPSLDLFAVSGLQREAGQHFRQASA